MDLKAAKQQLTKNGMELKRKGEKPPSTMRKGRKKMEVRRESNSTSQGK